MGIKSEERVGCNLMKKQNWNPDRGYEDLDLIQKEKWHV